LVNLQEKLQTSSFSLITSIYSNQSKLAVAAEKAGSDAIIVNINTANQSGSNRFGSFEFEEDSIREIINNVKIPVGLFIGDTAYLNDTDWGRIINSGLDFINMFAHFLPFSILVDKRISKMVSIGPGYLIEQVKSLSDDPNIDSLLSSVTPSQAIGQNLNALDLSTVKILANLSSKPLLLLTQKTFSPEHVEYISKIGCKGLVLNDVVIGKTEDSMDSAIKSYRRNINLIHN